MIKATKIKSNSFHWQVFRKILFEKVFDKDFHANCSLVEKSSVKEPF